MHLLDNPMVAYVESKIPAQFLSTVLTSTSYLIILIGTVSFKVDNP